jgi:hypothetical protein
MTERIHNLWIVARSDEIIYALGTSQREAWDAACERLYGLPAGTPESQYQRLSKALRKQGWRARRCDLSVRNS